MTIGQIIHEIAKKTLEPLRLYSPLQKKWQRMRELRHDAETYRNINSSIKRHQAKYTEAGKWLYGYIKFSSEHLVEKPTVILKIPENIQSIKIDIGLSYTAPNSALWIKRKPRTFVFGFEPNHEAVDYLFYGNLNRKKHILPLVASLRKLGGMDSQKFLGTNFILFDIAIDDCDPCMKDFYLTEGVGTSSFYHPTDIVTAKHPEAFNISEHRPVPTIRLADFMSLLPWDRFPYIEQIKIDTQGNDVRVLKSAGDYLKKVVFVTAEVFSDKQYEYSHTEKELDDLMTLNDFEFIKDTDHNGNKTYANRLFKHLWKTLDYKTVDV